MTIDELSIIVLDIQKKVDQLYLQSGGAQKEVSMYFQEQQLMTRLRMDGLSHAEALDYIDRIYKGEKPWREDRD